MTAEQVALLGMTGDQLAAAAELAVGRGAGVWERVYAQAFRIGALDPAGLSEDAAQRWRQAFAVELPQVHQVVEEPGATAKAILRLADGRLVEIVRIPMRYAEDGVATAFTLCLSSQVGCRMGCAFCETGLMGLVRQLTAAEIVGQVVAARVHLGWEARNLVFMGMGEALDNADHVIQALRVLTDRRAFGFSHERLTVCTSGHADGIGRIAALGWKRLNLSISLNAADDATRSRLMPVNRKTPLAELQRILAAYPQRRNFTLGVNWCLMPGLNDGPGVEQQIADFCRPLGRVLINLIPYNPGSQPLTRAPDEDEVVAFIDRLRAVGLPVRRRITKGRSIMAACGQLGDVTQRRKPVRT